jgi:hypothetical protein
MLLHVIHGALIHIPGMTSPPPSPPPCRAKQPESVQFLSEYALDASKSPQQASPTLAPGPPPHTTTTAAGPVVNGPMPTGKDEGQPGSRNAWVLGVKHDSWRVMAVGSEGLTSMWNHWASQRVYSLLGRHILHGEGGRAGAVVEPVPLAPGFALFADPMTSGAEAGPGAEGRGVDEGSTGRTSPASTPLKAITAVDFNDEHIIASCMDGKVHIWEAL